MKTKSTRSMKKITARRYVATMKVRASSLRCGMAILDPAIEHALRTGKGLIESHPRYREACEFERIQRVEMAPEVLVETHGWRLFIEPNKWVTIRAARS